MRDISYEEPGIVLYCCDVVEGLKQMADESVQCVVTSPPYWGLRDYKTPWQIGLEKTPEDYVAVLVTVFREVRRVLRKDGTCWLNLGDSYAGSGKGIGSDHGKAVYSDGDIVKTNWETTGLKPKDLVGIPWRVAFALQADDWWLRSDIIYSKPNPMPESVTDRPTKSHEYLFLMAKNERYYYDQEAILEPVSDNTHMRLSQDLANQIGSQRANGGAKTNGPMKAVGRKASMGTVGVEKQNESFEQATCLPVSQRNKRSVWTIPTQSYSGAHFATFPEKLVEPCVLAGSRPGDIVLDPFAGSGTTLAVAKRLGRKAVGIELSPAYCELAAQRIQDTMGSLF